MRLTIITRLCLLLWMLTASAAFAADLPLQLTDKEQHWLTEHSKIRIGVMNAWPPMDYLDSAGVPQGIGVEFIKALNKRYGNRFEIVPGEWKTIYEAVKQKKLDAVMDITARVDREPFFNFTKPYIKIPHLIFTRKDASPMLSLSDLNDKKVGVEKNFYISKVLRKKYPRIHVTEYKDTSDALDALSKGEVDAYIGNRAVATYIIENELISNLMAQGKISETSSVNSIGVRKDWPILRDILQKGLSDISREERRNILAKWISPIKSVSAVVNLSISEKQWLKTHPVIRVAFDENYPPYSFRNEQGKIVGIAVDYAQELAKRVGLTIEVYPEGQWKQLYAAAQRRDVDVIATLVKREERKQWFEFTRPYLSLAQYVVTKKDNMQNINRRAQLAGKTVALIKDYSMTKVILEEIKNIQPYYVNNLNEALEAVSAGKADATIGAIGMANHLISKAGLLNLGFAAPYSKGQSEQRFGVRNDWPELASILDKALQSLTDKEVINIFGRWTRAEVTKAEAELFDTIVKLTYEERLWLSKHPIIRTASDPNWAPIEYVDEEGKFLGISADYIERLEKMLGIKFKLVKGQTWQQMVKNFKKGEIDLFTSLNNTPERKKYMNFTRSYTQFPIGIFAGSESNFILDMEELKGKKVGVVKGYATQELLETNYPNIELVMAQDPIEALDMVSHEEIDAYVGNILVTTYYIGKLGYTHLKVVGKTPYQYEQSIGVRKDWPIFISILNKALDAISESEKNTIYKKWIGVTFEHEFDYSLLWKILLVVMVLLIIFAYWNHKISLLNKQLIIARNKEEQARKTVEEANKELQAVDKLKSMFIASISHELRTPLNSIIGFSSMMAGGAFGELNEKYQDYTFRINNSGKHLLSLITDIIDISKIEAGRIDIVLEDFNLDEIVIEAVTSLSEQIEQKGLSINTSVASGIAMRTDKRRLYQSLLNLLSNAMKYSEKGKITLTVEQQENEICIKVEDTGIGISEIDLPRLFEAFERMQSQLKVKAGGTGLGLYLTKKIVTEILQGNVGVESKLGEGSLFWIKVPKSINQPNIPDIEEGV